MLAKDLAAVAVSVATYFTTVMKLAFSRARFDSAEAAERCFQSELQQASKIVEREILFDEAHEKVVGERVSTLR